MSVPNSSIAVLGISLHIPASQSLKEKRRVLKSIKDRIRHAFNVSISEVGELDKWQTCQLGMAMISNDRGLISGTFEKILSLIETVAEVRMIRHRLEFL